MNVIKTNDGWKIESAVSLTDSEAAAIAFLATAQQITLGEYVEVIDPGGTRIGHLSGATYHERWNGPAYVVCSITLR